LPALRGTHKREPRGLTRLNGVVDGSRGLSESSSVPLLNGRDTTLSRLKGGSAWRLSVTDAMESWPVMARATHDPGPI
jgi:hypothetical protein